MRQLTAYASYLDNLGAPLVGRARFCNLDGSPAVVYGLDNAHQHYVQLGHIVYTNSSGQLMPQVFLADHDYLVVFDKYIGGGTMAEDDDPESWQEMGSAVDKYNTVGIELDGSAVRSFGTVDALRVALPVESADGDNEIVELLGYNEPGDKPSIQYQWDPDSSEPDNGGSVLGTVAVGRWKLVECPEFLDVRHFGAFPAQTSSANVNQRNAIQLAGAYAHTNGCGLYFTGTSLAAFYDITTLELYDVASDDTACLFAIKNGNDDIMATLYNVVNVKCATDQGTAFADQGRIQLNGSVLRTSYAPDYRAKLVPSQRLIVDSVLKFSKSFHDIIVECHVPLTDDGDTWSLTSCIVISNFANEAGWGSTSGSIIMNSASASMILTALTVIGMTVAGNASIGGNLAIGGSTVSLGNDYSLTWVNGSGGTPSNFKIKQGSTTVMEFDGTFAEFANALGIPNGFQVDNDNFLMQPEGERAKYLSLKIDALLDLTSKTGTDSGIKFDRINVTKRARINRVVTDYIEPSANASIAMSGGIRRTYSESTVTFSSWGDHDLGLLSNFSTTSKFNIVMAWAWSDSSSVTVSDYAYLEGAHGKSNLEIICIENCGPKEPNYEPATLARDGDFETIADKSGPLFILGGPEAGYTNKIIDVIPPFSRKHFMWLENEGRWTPVSV